MQYRETMATKEQVFARHPCFGAARNRGRIHLPVCPVCNISCNFCVRSLNEDEDRPGVTAQVISPEEAVEVVRRPGTVCLSQASVHKGTAFCRARGGSENGTHPPPDPAGGGSPQPGGSARRMPLLRTVPLCQTALPGKTPAVERNYAGTFSHLPQGGYLKYIYEQPLETGAVFCTAFFGGVENA